MANPLFSEKSFENIDYAYDPSEVMTVSSTLNKVGVLMVLLFATAGISWTALMSGWPIAPAMIPLGFGGGFVTAIILIFKKEWANALAPTYAILEGMALGALSAIYGGIAFLAIGLTFGVVAIMWVLFKTNILRATQKFVAGVAAATGAVFLIYLMTWILGFFNVSVPYIHEAGLIGIGFSLVVVVIAAMNLIIDFELIEQGAAQHAPKYMEWYAAFGLMVTIIWLYLEILRLLSKLSKR